MKAFPTYSEGAHGLLHSGKAFLMGGLLLDHLASFLDVSYFFGGLVVVGRLHVTNAFSLMQ